jgi:outer membrane murein-binding lipoprotein Lpp
VTVISSVYIWITLSERILGDYLFGLIIPVGLLVLVALAVTFGLPLREDTSEKETKLEATVASGMQEINSKIDSLTKEVDKIKKAIEE